eukprot:GHVT01027790.1.p1 GENE.GHVT01027790.1~~GHVT01027790.1.p1  ORF type:complete len:145 (+),score=17.55 GHVT01027790.1:299-733(+)
MFVLVSRTGQGPWRFLEVISIVLVFVFGCASFGVPGWQGWVATLMVVGGRYAGARDVLVNAALAEEIEASGGGRREAPRAVYAPPESAAPPPMEMRQPSAVYAPTEANAQTNPEVEEEPVFFRLLGLTAFVSSSVSMATKKQRM